MSSGGASLSERLADHTAGLILDSAIDLLEHSSVPELTVRAVAARANISERTVFRHFATRDVFLDAIATAVSERLALPPEPRTMADLLAYPDSLYRRFEAKASLIRAGLHSDLFDRMRERAALKRWVAVSKLVDAHAPRRPARERKLAAANIRYFLTATTWHYYRYYFGFELEEAIASAQTAIRQAIEGLGGPAQLKRTAMR